MTAPAHALEPEARHEAPSAVGEGLDVADGVCRLCSTPHADTSPGECRLAAERSHRVELDDGEINP